MAIIEMAEAARHLRLDTSDPYWETEDEGLDLASKMMMAEAIVIDYLKHPAEAVYWDEDTAPFPVKAAMLLVLSDLWEHRAGSANEDVFLSSAVKSLLHRFRDPALA